MTTRVAFPNTVSQSGDSSFSSFDGLENVKSNTSTYAVTKLIKGKTSSPNRPKVIVATNFKLNLPNGSKVNSIKVEYVQDTEPYDNKHISIPAPTLTLKNIANNTYQKKGVAPDKYVTTRSVTFKPNNDSDFDVANINSSDFGVYLNYPANTSSNSGYMRVKFIRITVDYVEPDFTVAWESPPTVEQGETFSTNLSISNKNLTSYQPTLTILTPAGFSLQGTPSGDGTWVKVDNRQYTWQPNFTSAKGSITLGLSFRVNVTGTLPVSSTFEAILDGESTTKTVSVVEKPVPTPPEQDEDPYQQVPDSDMNPVLPEIVHLATGKTIKLNFHLTQAEYDRIMYRSQNRKKIFLDVYTNPNFEGEIELINTITMDVDTEFVYVDGYYECTSNFYSNIVSEITVTLRNFDGSNYESFRKINIDVYPSSLNPPASAILTLSDEELDRLGDGIVYNVCAMYLKEAPETVFTQTAETSATDPGSPSAENGVVITTLENSELGDSWEVSFDFKTNTESRLYIGNSNYATTRNPNQSVFLGSLNGSQWYYGYRTSTTYSTNITGTSLNEYHHMKIRRDGSKFYYIIDGKQYTYTIANTTINWGNFTSISIGLKVWGSGTAYVKNLIVKNGNMDSYIKDWGKNYRILVFNNPIKNNLTSYEYIDENGETHDVTYESTHYDSLPLDDMINNAEYSSPIITKGNGLVNELVCQFPYNKDYPLYIIISGDYNEVTTPAKVRFSTPNLIEAEVFQGREPSGNYPIPIRNLLTTDEATITIPTYEKATTVIVYDFDLNDGYGTNSEIAIRGIEVTVTIDGYDDCILSAQLKSPTGAIGERSVAIESDMLDDNNTLHIGGIGDLWSFNTLDLVNLEDWEIQLTFSNLLIESDLNINYDDVKIIFYTEQIESQRAFCYVNGEDIRYYGAFVKDIDIPAGLKTSTSFLNISGTDTNDAYRQNIREKEIKLELEIGDDCDLEMATNSLRQLTQLLLNERDKYNRPIPKQIQFSFMPDVYYEYIIEDTFENPIEISSYNVKATLTVPSGTAFKNKSTTTNTVGFVQGLAKVNPVITLKPTGANMEILEMNSGQKFTITYNEGDLFDSIIVIDTNNRRVYLKTDEDSSDSKDISKYVDFNSDWFVLHGMYNFSSTNCFIRTVTYTERW